jgi:CCR4-NOT transcriptional regulation complex NOT5 subunit
MTALEKQVGGDHYKKVEVQPIQIAYMLGCTPLWVKVCKYITREKEDKIEDFQKAIHCIELENEMIELRSNKYMAEMVRYEQEDIKKFAMQYEDGEFIDEVLQHVYFGHYKKAAEAICDKAGFDIVHEGEVV